MASLQSALSFHRALFLNVASQAPYGRCHSRRSAAFQVKAKALQSHREDRHGRRQSLILGAVVTSLSLCHSESALFAAEAKKGYQSVLDKKDGYTFLYPFGWQEVVVQGQDKVYKDVIEPLESVSINMVPTGKEDLKELGSPQEVAEALIKKVLAPTSQKTKLVQAKEHDVEGKTYYTFEFLAQAPNFTRHGLGTVSIGNGKFYALTTGANERRWDKIKDKLVTVVESFKIFTPTTM